MGDQDWTDVVLKKRTPKPATVGQAVSQARQSGVPVETVKKFGGGQNKSVVGSGAGPSAKRLDEETEVMAHAKVDRSVADTIKRRRADLKMTQKELAVKINEREGVINEYERGTAIPNNTLLGKLEKALGVKLRGKDIGALIEKPVPKAAAAAAKK